MRRVVQASLAAVASIGLLTALAEAQTRRAPAVAGPAVTPERAALLSTQPIGIDVVLTALGWIKACPVAAEPRNCSVAGAFALAPDQSPNLRVSVGTASTNGTRALAVVLPVDVALRPGFTIVFDDGQAVLGDYTTCGGVGCSGEVGLSDPVYQQLVRSKRVGILIGNAADKVLRLNLPIDGLGAAVTAPATPGPEIARRRELAAERLKAKEKADQSP